MSALCAAHRAEHDAWLDYRLPPAPLRITSQAGYDYTAPAARERRSHRFAQWRDTIRHAQASIRTSCDAGRGCSDAPQPA